MTDSSRKNEKPSAAEIDYFLAAYNLGEHTSVERIEITKAGKFEFFMFAVWDNEVDPKLTCTSLIIMWPTKKPPESDWT